MRKPWYQKIVTSYISWLIASFVFVGAILDTISNAFDLITPRITFAGTIVVILLFISARVLLRQHPLRWVTEDNQLVYLKSIGLLPTLTLLGILIALWTPYLLGNHKAENTSQSTEPSETNNNTTLSTPIPTEVRRSFNTIKDVFPEFLGYAWTYNVSQATESPPDESVRYEIGQFTRRIASIETGISDYARIIAVDQSGENYMSECSASLTSGDLDIWHVVDSTRFYTACSKEEAYQLAVDIRNESQNGTTDRLSRSKSSYTKLLIRFDLLILA